MKRDIASFKYGVTFKPEWRDIQYDKWYWFKYDESENIRAFSIHYTYGPAWMRGTVNYSSKLLKQLLDRNPNLEYGRDYTMTFGWTHLCIRSLVALYAAINQFMAEGISTVAEAGYSGEAIVYEQWFRTKPKSYLYYCNPRGYMVYTSEWGHDIIENGWVHEVPEGWNTDGYINMYHWVDGIEKTELVASLNYMRHKDPPQPVVVFTTIQIDDVPNDPGPLPGRKFEDPDPIEQGTNEAITGHGNPAQDVFSGTGWFWQTSEGMMFQPESGGAPFVLSLDNVTTFKEERSINMAKPINVPIDAKKIYVELHR